jgi:outer membrane protein assembly factor BamB
MSARWARHAAIAWALALALSARDAIWAQNWPMFRGAAMDGIVAAGSLPTEWGPDQNVAWKAKMPGVGWSQPVVWGDRVFVTTAVAEGQSRPDPGNQGPGFGQGGLAGLFGKLQPPQYTVEWKLLCLDAATGNVVWEKTARAGQPPINIHPNNTYATETPATDGERVVAYFGMAGVYCYDFKGELLWSKELGVHPMQFGWGTASSPVLHEGAVYIQCDNDEASFLVALDAMSGDIRWRKERDELSNLATPYVWRNRVRTELVTAGGNRMRSYDPASGEVLWEMQGQGRTATTPVGDGERLYVDSYDRLTGQRGELAAIRPGASGNISLAADESSSEFIAWSLPLTGSRMATPLAYQGSLYVLDSRGGVVRCLDAENGAQRYRKRVPGATGFVASPLAQGDRIYLLDEDGRTSVVSAGDELELEAASDLGEMCWSSPAVAGDRLLIRTIDHLYCVGK